MKRLLSLFALTAALALGQSAVALTGPPNARPGATIPLALTLNGPSTNQITAMQWLISFPAGGYSATVTPGAVSSSASKAVQCTSDESFCLSTGPNITVIPNGTVANYSLKLPATALIAPVTVSVSGILAVSPAGDIALTNATASYTFSMLPALEDITGDGLITQADYNAMVAQVLGFNQKPSIPCTADPFPDGKCDVRDVVAINKRLP